MIDNRAFFKMVYPPSLITYDESRLDELNRLCPPFYLNELEFRMLRKDISFDSFFEFLHSCYHTYLNRCKFENQEPEQEVIAFYHPHSMSQVKRFLYLKALGYKIMSNAHILKNQLEEFRRTHVVLNGGFNETDLLSGNSIVDNLRNEALKISNRLFLSTPTSMSVAAPTPMPVAPPPTPMPAAPPPTPTPMPTAPAPTPMSVAAPTPMSVAAPEAGQFTGNNMDKIHSAMEYQFVKDVAVAYTSIEGCTALSICDKMCTSSRNSNGFGFHALSSAFSAVKRGKRINNSILKFFLMYFVENIHEIFSSKTPIITELQERADVFVTI